MATAEPCALQTGHTAPCAAAACRPWRPVRRPAHHAVHRSRPNTLQGYHGLTDCRPWWPLWRPLPQAGRPRAPSLQWGTTGCLQAMLICSMQSTHALCSDKQCTSSSRWQPLSTCLLGQAPCPAGTKWACIAPSSRQHVRPPCLQAMVATVEAYAADEAAQRIIPAVAPLGVDPVSEVRQSALAALSAFMRLLTEHSTQLESAATTTGSAAGDIAQVTLPSLTSHLGHLFAGSPEADGPAQDGVVECGAGPLRCHDHPEVETCTGVTAAIYQGLHPMAATVQLSALLRPRSPPKQWEWSGELDLWLQGSAAGGWSVGLTSNLGWALSGFGGKAKGTLCVSRLSGCLPASACMACHQSCRGLVLLQRTAC